MKQIYFLFFSFLVLIFAGCATVSQEPTLYAPKDKLTLQQLCTQYNIDWHWDSVAQVITLNHDGVVTQAMIDSPVVLMGKKQIYLSEPLRREQSAIIVPADFKNKVIGTTIKRASTTSISYKVTSLKKVIVDAGHGGKDVGAIGYRGTHEKDIALDIARRLKKGLERHGIEVVMTRDSDRFLSLAERTALASKTDADLFVSIHANASKSRSARGFEVFYNRPLNSKDRQEIQRRENEKTRMRAMSLNQSEEEVKSILSDLMYEYKFRYSRRLADYVSHTVSRAVRAKNRGDKPEGFYVLRNTLIPSILVETGFLSNPHDEKLLKNSRYQQKISDSLTRSIIYYAQQS